MACFRYSTSLIFLRLNGLSNSAPWRRNLLLTALEYALKRFEKYWWGCFTLSGVKKPHQYFSNLFNAYSKAVNKRFLRHGALFERPFKRKKINDVEYLKQAILYIHH